MFSAVTLLGCEEEGIIRLRVEGAFDPERLEFGEVPVDDSKSLPVALANIGNVDFEIVSVDVPEGFALRGIKEQFEGSVLRAGMKTAFEVVFIPTVDGERSAELVVHISDEETVVLELHGVGSLVRLPSVVALPGSIDFGTVELGGESRANVTLRNDGNAPGTIQRLRLDSNGDEFSLITPLPITIAAEGSQQIELLFAPTTQGVKSDRMQLELAEAVPPVSIALNGEGRIPLGEILCEPSRVDFGPVERGQTLSRTVDCTARGGAARLVGAHIEGATDQFFLPTSPGTVDLTENQSFSLDVAFVPDGLPDVHSGELVVDFAGDGGPGTAVVLLTGEVVPPPPTATAVTVVLSWNTNNTDIDLHLTRPSSRPDAYDSMFQADADCYFGNPAPDWNVANDASDDPFLDDDDVDGFGPETINLEQTGPGSYDVFVHYYSDLLQGTSTANVEIYLAGQLAGTFNRPGFECNEIWHVGTINWNGTTGTFSPVNQMHNTTRGACF